jgi:hypothetical protein
VATATTTTPSTLQSKRPSDPSEDVQKRDNIKVGT